jgi:PAS domain S-box-containing protein
MVMLEDQSEERACLHALGLLDKEADREFEREAAGNEALRRVAAELEETLTNLALSTTTILQPAPALRERLLARIDAEPARVTTDRWGHIETINPAFTNLCGYGLEELRGRKPGHVLQGMQTDPEAIDALRQAVKSGSACDVELTNYHKDGSAYRVHIQLDPVRNPDESVVGFVARERLLERVPA